MSNETADFPNSVCERETGKALLVRLGGESKPRWMPKAVVHDDSEVFREGHRGKLVVQLWFAEKEGLI